MRDAIAGAVVGDDALGDDPTVRDLEADVAEILGKPAAVFFPSGIMANQTALLMLGERGTEVVCDASAHIVDWELGGAAVNAGLQLKPVTAQDGLTPDLVEAAIRPGVPYQIRTSLVAIENTHNAAGGRIMPLDTMRAIRDVAVRRSVPIHLDGARLWNAAAATGLAEADFAACADTVMVTLSKGLGCPVGSLLAGEDGLMTEARLVRRRLGGTMRQAGILAAAGLHALRHHRARLVDDHARARLLANLVAGVSGLRATAPETNIVMMDIERGDLDAAAVLHRLASHGVLMTQFTPKRIRAVTHLDVDDGAVHRAADALSAVFAAE